MDHDNVNLNNAAEDQREWWEAYHKEQRAKAEKMDAEQRMKYNDALDNFSEEVDAASDWVAADWDQFKARVAKWSNDFELKADKAV